MTQHDWHTAPPAMIRMSSGPHDRMLIVADKVLCRHTVPNRAHSTGLHPGRRSSSKQDHRPPDSPPDYQITAVPTRNKGESAQNRRSRRPSSQSAPGDQPGAIPRQRARYQPCRKAKNTRFAHYLGDCSQIRWGTRLCTMRKPPWLVLSLGPIAGTEPPLLGVHRNW